MGIMWTVSWSDYRSASLITVISNSKQLEAWSKTRASRLRAGDKARIEDLLNEVQQRARHEGLKLQVRRPGAVILLRGAKH